MTRFLSLCGFVLFFLGMRADAETLILDYADFGPQVAVYEYLGYEWWQWEPEGCSSHLSEHPVKVIVYSDESLRDVKEKYLVSQEKHQDYRYIEAEDAIELLQNQHESLGTKPTLALIKKAFRSTKSQGSGQSSSGQ